MHIMKLKFISFFVITLWIAGCVESSDTNTSVELLSAEEMDSILALEKVQLIDVRTETEFLTGHIPGAINIDYRDPDFASKLESIDKSKPIAVYCKKGGRSSACSKDMKKAGFTKIYDLEGGITQWMYEGKRVEK